MKGTIGVSKVLHGYGDLKLCPRSPIASMWLTERTIYSALQQRLLSQPYMLSSVVKMSTVVRSLVISNSTAPVLWGPQIGGKGQLGGEP